MATTTRREFRSEFMRNVKAEGHAEGRAEGEARAVLTVLVARGIDVTDDARARIMSCTDVDQLDTWARRAATATTIDQVLD